MLGKLALRNAKKSFKDYLIYLITVIIAFALIFAFNIVVFSKDITNLSNVMSNFKYSIIAVSIIVVFVIGWLINYTMKFMLEKRSKEFGIYLILGLEKKSISKLFILENIVLGTIAFLFSLLIGIILSQIMMALILNIFKMPYVIEFYVSLESVLYTIGYFILIYLFAFFNNGRKIKKMKVCDLLNFNKKNENQYIKKSKSKIILLIISIIFIALALLLINYTFSDGENKLSMNYILLSFVLLIVGLYGIYINISSLILSLILKSKKRKYKNNNLFIIRNFTSKINTMSITLGTLAFLICATFICLNISGMFKTLYDSNLENVPYDIAIYNKGNDSDFEDYLDFTKKYYTIKQQYIHTVYIDESNFINKKLSTTYSKKDSYIKISDYNILMEMAGYEKTVLNDDEYLIHCASKLKNDFINFIKNNQLINISEINLKNKSIITENFVNSWAQGSDYIVVIPDNAIANLIVDKTYISINTLEKTTESFYKELSSYIANLENDTIDYNGVEVKIVILGNVTIKGAVDAENNSIITIISFSLMYLSLVFIATAGTILAIQSLSDSVKYKFRYTVLKKLGTDNDEINKIIFKQLFIYFLFPFLIPFILSIVITLSTAQLFTHYLSISMVWTDIFKSFVVFLIVYSIYFITTLFRFKSNANTK
jgi:putative ABC transport system permease protein